MTPDDKPKKPRKRPPVPKFVPDGDNTILPVKPVKITKKDIDKAFAAFDGTFPDLAGLLDAEVERG
jgi:hypothetical protein